jgi:hypothetical protein
MRRMSHRSLRPYARLRVLVRIKLLDDPLGGNGWGTGGVRSGGIVEGDGRGTGGGAAGNPSSVLTSTSVRLYVGRL